MAHPRAVQYASVVVDADVQGFRTVDRESGRRCGRTGWLVVQGSMTVGERIKSVADGHSSRRRKIDSRFVTA